jgi:hypothetical protein
MLCAVVLLAIIARVRECELADLPLKISHKNVLGKREKHVMRARCFHSNRGKCVRLLILYQVKTSICFRQNAIFLCMYKHERKVDVFSARKFHALPDAGAVFVFLQKLSQRKCHFKLCLLTQLLRLVLENVSSDDLKTFLQNFCLSSH